MFSSQGGNSGCTSKRNVPLGPVLMMMSLRSWWVRQGSSERGGEWVGNRGMAWSRIANCTAEKKYNWYIETHSPQQSFSTWILCTDLFISLPSSFPPCPGGWFRLLASCMPVSQVELPRNCQHSGEFGGFWLIFALVTTRWALLVPLSMNYLLIIKHQPHTRYHSRAWRKGEPGKEDPTFWSLHSVHREQTTNTSAISKQACFRE